MGRLGASELFIADCRYAIHGCRVPFAGTGYTTENICNIDLILVLLPSFVRYIAMLKNNYFCTDCSKITLYGPTWDVVYCNLKIVCSNTEMLGRIIFRKRNFSPQKFRRPPASRFFSLRRTRQVTLIY